MKTLKAALLILSKDLKLEYRTKEILISIFLFALVILVLFNFAFESTSQEALKIIPGLLWIAYTFSAVLAFNRAMAIEKENEGLEALALAPISSSAIFLGKFLSNATFISLMQIFLLPFVTVFFNISLVKFSTSIVIINLLGSTGLASVGTFFSTLSLHTRMRDILLPLLLFPIIVPLLLACVECTSSILENDFTFYSNWFRLLISYDVIFLTLCILIFEFLIEE
ncbi:MAG: heme exporter protein CcmB [Chlamydiae bacterium]|nr:heme exporter protein CcmB [Chlamydiota bacterium]